MFDNSANITPRREYNEVNHSVGVTLRATVHHRRALAYNRNGFAVLVDGLVICKQCYGSCEPDRKSRRADGHLTGAKVGSNSIDVCKVDSFPIPPLTLE